MTDPARHHPSEDPVTRRVREAFARLEPSVELDEVLARAAPYLRRTARPAGRDQQAAGRARAAGQPLGRLAAVRPAPTPSPAGSGVDPIVGVPAGRSAAALAGDRHATGTRRARDVVVVGGVELSGADLAAARRRDPEAVSRIYQAFAPSLLRFFVAAVGDRRAAEDLTGTVLAAAIEDLPGFRGEVTKLGGWLFRIARHDLYDYRRRAARARSERLDEVLDEAALAEDPPGPQELAVEQLEGARVVAALEQLSPDQREVLLLRLAAGLTAPEVAATLGKTTGAVKALQHRGLASLARVLGLPVAGQRQDDAGRRDDEQQPDDSALPEHPDTAS
jgi:RNA polymerase sigma-70 factor, ECF subfamily